MVIQVIYDVSSSLDLSASHVGGIMVLNRFSCLMHLTTCEGVASLKIDNSNAAVPVTNGVAKLVPLN